MPEKPTVDVRLNGLTKLIFIVFCLWLPLVVFWANYNMATLDRQSLTRLPFGVFRDKGSVYLQDFSYNILYFKGINERLVSHPYRLEDQETLIRQMVPGITAGMSHAYSPVGLVLALPLINMPGARAFLIYTSFSAFATLLLFHYYLLPRVSDQLQLYALSVSVFGTCFIVAFQLGQSALITTPVAGAFWALLQRRTVMTGIFADVLLGALFWILCLKPSVALIPLFLLVGARAWRVLIFGMFLLLLTWLFSAEYYGGLWSGLQDYAFLLNHYDNDEFTPFMRRGNELPFALNLTALDSHAGVDLFLLSRSLVLISNLGLLFLRWTNRITASEHFQGTIWSFLLFSPYLSGSEYWILCLLIPEGDFFTTSKLSYSAAKVVLVAGILLFGTTTLVFVCKWILFTWIIFAAISKRTQPSWSKLHVA